MSFNKNRESSRYYLKTIFKKFPNFNGFMINKFHFKINNAHWGEILHRGPSQ